MEKFYIISLSLSLRLAICFVAVFPTNALYALVKIFKALAIVYGIDF